MIAYLGLLVCWLIFSIYLVRFAFIRLSGGSLYRNRFLRILIKALALSHIATPTLAGAAGFWFVLPASLAVYGLIFGYITNFMNLRVYPVKFNIIVALCAMMITSILFFIVGLLISYIKERMNTDK
jgi:hypothetical protein